MAAALLLMIVSGMFMSAWISLMSSRGLQVSLMDTAAKRRLAVENSRLFAWQCSLEKAFDPVSTLAANSIGLLGTDRGGLDTASGWTNLNIYESLRTVGNFNSRAFPYNYSSVKPTVSFAERINFKRPDALADVDNFLSYSFLKSYPAVFSGDLFTYYKKPEGGVYGSLQIEVINTLSSVASWVVQGRTVVRDAASFFALTTPSPLQIPFQTRTLLVQSHDPFRARLVVGSAVTTGVKLIPSNLPSIPSTTGPVSGVAADQFKGYLNVIKNDLNTSNSMWHFMDREKAAGRTNFITLDVFAKSATTTGAYWMDYYSGADGSIPIYRPYGYTAAEKPEPTRTLYIQLDHVDLTHLRITNPVDQIVLLGQKTTAAFDAAGRAPPIMIAVVQDASSPPLINVAFVGNNNRRFTLGVKVVQPINRGLYFNWMDWADGTAPSVNPDWRMVYINEGQFTMLKLPTSLSRSIRWIGGVMTNWTIKRHIDDGMTASRLTFVSDSSLPITGTITGPLYASLVPRDAWLEPYFYPTQPVEK